MAELKAKFQSKAFGEYYLLERIAVGGMAEIFKAKTYGVGGFEKLLAIKRILPHHAQNQEFISMLIDEAKIAVALNHVNIVQVYDLGKIEGDYFIAMEYVEGRDLRSLIRRCKKMNVPISIENAVYIILEICKGLDYAHRKTDRSGKNLGIVHRDISPQNILISFEGEVKIVDFGIAKAANKITETDSGILKGKFSYMSPEHAGGCEVDQRTDIFSTAIIMYELLVGEKLFMGPNHLEILEKIKQFHIEPPFLPSDIPSELEYILAHALAPSLKDRYQHASDFQVELTKFLYSSSLDFTARNIADLMHQLFHREYEDEKNREKVDFELDEATRSFMLKGHSQSLVSKTDFSVDTSSEDITHTGERLAPAKNRTVIKKFRKVLRQEDFESQSKIKPSVSATATSVDPALAEITEKIPPPMNARGVADRETSKISIRKEFEALEREDSQVKPALSQVWNAQIANFTEELRRLPLASKIKLILTFCIILVVLWTVVLLLTRSKTKETTAKKEEIKESSPLATSPVSSPTGKEPRILAKQGGEIDLTSVPSAARVVVNNEYAGLTPLAGYDLPANATVLITLEKPGYESLSFPLSVKPQDRITIHKILEKSERLLKVESEPSGAQVFLDGKLRGSTPFQTRDLEAGVEYLLVVRSQGFRDDVRKVKLDAHEPKKIMMRLQAHSSRWGTIFVDSQPKGAKLILNGEALAQKTPGVIEKIPLGKGNTLKVEYPYYESVTYRDLKVNADDIMRLTPVLKRLKGKIMVKSTPPNAQIYFSNQLQGETPRTIALDCGVDYVIEIRKDGFKSVVQKVKLESTESQILDLTLEGTHGTN